MLEVHLEISMKLRMQRVRKVRFDYPELAKHPGARLQCVRQVKGNTLVKHRVCLAASVL